jgi:hypothetical protein
MDAQANPPLVFLRQAFIREIIQRDKPLQMRVEHALVDKS